MNNSITTFETEALNRKRAMLRSAFGPVIAAALAEPQVIEVMVNPDGRLWLDRLDQGRIATETRLQWSEVERIIRLVASHIRLEVHERFYEIGSPQGLADTISYFSNSLGA